MTANAWRTFLSLGLGLTMGTTLPSQRPQNGAPGLPDIVALSRTAAGITVDGDTVWGLGPDYKASFTDGGVEFTPALGLSAPRNFPLRFTLQSIRRGANVLYEQATAIPAKPLHDGLIVSYDRGPGLVETYRIDSVGVEQSFVFAQRPKGAGDLVVRGRIDTELTAEGTGGSDGLRFLSPDLGGVKVGAVTGIDAVDWTVPGGLRFDGRTIELTLPSDLVDNATYPLTLDPWLTSEFLIGTPTARNLDPDVAFDETHDYYMIVWERVFSITNVDIRAAIVDATGATVTSLIGITGAFVNLNPCIASIDAYDDFFIVYQKAPSILGQYDIKGRNWDIGAAALSPEVTLAGSTFANEINPDVGGDATPMDDRVTVVWEQQGAGIEARWVDQQGTGTPVLGPKVDLSTDARDKNPAISKSGGADGRWLVVFERETSASNCDIRAVSLGRNTAILDSAHSVASTSLSELDPDVDGDGTTFMAAWQREESAGSSSHDLYARTVRLSGSGSIGNLSPITVVENTAGDDEIQPAVSFLGVKYIVAFADQAAGINYDIKLVQLNEQCLACGSTYVSYLAPDLDFHPEMASRYSGDATQNFGNGDRDAALVVFESGANSPPFDLQIQGRLFEAIGSGGAVTNLWSGCGLGGSIRVRGPVAIGNPNFEFTLTGADAGTTVYAIGLGLGGAPLSCGSCTIVDGDWEFLLPSGLPGTMRKPIAIPCRSVLIGLSIDAQWIAFGTRASPCPLAATLSASNAIRVTLDI